MSDRVYCTADGEYPKENELVIFEVENIQPIYRGYFYKRSLPPEMAFYSDGLCHYSFTPDKYKIYWKPLTSLKDEYEKQKENA